MFKAESLSHQINIIRPTTGSLRYGLVTFTEKKDKETGIRNSARENI